MSAAAPTVSTDALTLSYGGEPVVRNLSLDIADGSLTVLIGPNASGKSTILKALARLVRPRAGRVMLDGVDIAGLKPRDLARRLAMLPQSPDTPPNVIVRDLVLRGRAPYQSLLRQYSRDDERAVAEAMRLTGVDELADRVVEELSGGQRQRVWIAVALAQETPILLLDEPTTYLDLAHQIDILELCASLHAQGRTLVVVLHDLNLAARYATDVVVCKDGRIAAQGTATEVITPELLNDVFGLAADVITDPQAGTPLIVPHAPAHLRTNR